MLDVRVEINKGAVAKVLLDPSIDRPLMSAARPIAGRLQAAVRKETNRTAASTRVTTGHLNAKRDRRAVRITMGGAAVALNWRTQRGFMARAAS